MTLRSRRNIRVGTPFGVRLRAGSSTAVVHCALRNEQSSLKMTLVKIVESRRHSTWRSGLLQFALVMWMALVVMGAPWAGSSSNYDGIFVGCHAVLNVGRHEQEAANGIGFDMTGIVCEAHL